MNKKRKIKDNLYKIKIENVFILIISNIICFLIFEILRYKIPNIINIHLNCNFEIDYIALYSCILSLVLPLAILLIEKINNKQDYILAETYLKSTMLFPAIIYFCCNIAFLAISKEQYYFIFCSMVSVYIIIYMYYVAFKLLSDLRYENEKISNVRYSIMNQDLFDQTIQYNDDNEINKYNKYGIKTKNNYINTENYKIKNIYPIHNLKKITSYNYKVIDKIKNYLEIINKEYIEGFENINENKKKEKERIPKIIIRLENIGSVLDKKKSCITVFYNQDYEKRLNNMGKLLDEKIYKFDEEDNHYYIKNNYEYIRIDCVKAINDMSAIIVENSLNKYMNLYRDYIDCIKESIGNYTYEDSYQQTHSLFRIKAYDFLEFIYNDIIDYSRMIVQKKECALMNEIISLLYSMILYSYEKKELLSIQYLYNLYNYLNMQSLKLDKKDSYSKIKLEIFEFINYIKYDFKIEEKDYQKDTLLVCNKTIGNIIFELSKKNEKYCKQYILKTFKFIDELKQENNQVKYSSKTKNTDISNIYTEVILNFECNIFATIAYIINKREKMKLEIDSFISYYSNYSVEEITSVFLETVNKDYNDNTYSWDLMEEHDLDECDGMWDVNTQIYLTHLYCCILNDYDINKIELPLSYPLSTHVQSIKEELLKMENPKLIKKFEDLLNKIDEDEKEYLRNNSICSKKETQFKNNFIDSYNKNAKLYNVMLETNNVEFVEKNEKGKCYLGLNNIVDKTYFLSKMPNDKNIIWTGFEENYANSFISAESKKYAKILEKNSIQKDVNLIEYLDVSEIKLENIIIFLNSTVLYRTIPYNNLKYEVPEDYKKKYIKADQYLEYKEIYIPIIEIKGLSSNYIYIVNKNKMGKMQKNKESFKIVINDFYNNDKLIEKFMNEKVSGLDITGQERKNHLLESVNIFIQEYIRFYEENIECYKIINNKVKIK